MIIDCAVVGGGPAGLNAALVLGRSLRTTILFDDNQPRNAVTTESHGFITRDGISPQAFKKIAHEDIKKYEYVTIEKQRVTHIKKEDNYFSLETANGQTYKAKKIIIATGFKEILPEIAGIKEFYGKSLFTCPFCDGWELRNRPLAVIAERPHGFHMAKLVSNWTKDVILFTNGKQILSQEEQSVLERKGIHVQQQKITACVGTNGQLEKIILDDGTSVLREGGFVVTDWKPAVNFEETLGYSVNEQGGIVTNALQQTNVKGVFACGDTKIAGASQLIIAAGEGSMAALAVNMELMQEQFQS